MFLSNLLGPVKKPIFEILYRSALRAAIQLEESGIEFRAFANRFLRLARAETLKIEIVNIERHHYLIEKIAWLIIISPEQDLQAVRREFLERLVYTNEVAGTFVLVCGFPPRWAWAQVSEGKRMNAQSLKREMELQKPVQMVMPQ
ncbi:hypothetical protein ANAEL_00605 [Anaerolineales bacterium]|nr:hypothetical protein ANAEL_00605 [Anaerolineales bacterium]